MTQATNAAEKMNGISDTLDNIYSLASDYNEFLMAFSSKFKEVITGVNRIYIDQYTLCSKSLWNKIKAIFGMKITVDYNQLERSQQTIFAYGMVNGTDYAENAYG